MTFGILGKNISYTLSPILHKLIWQQCDMTYDYNVYDTDSLDKLIPQIQQLSGFNITIPYKREIMPYLSTLSDEARLASAVNTVLIKNGKFYGHNTDIPGFSKALKDDIPNYDDYHPVIIGYGGAANAVIIALQTLGFSDCTIIGRNQAKLNEFVQNFSTKLSINILAEIDNNSKTLWINTTPIHINEFDFPLEINVEDSVYNLSYQSIIDSIFVKQYNGLLMLIYQAIEAEKIWFPKQSFEKLDVNLLKKQLLETLNNT